MTGEPILYSFRRCPYAIRARLALAISRTSCTVREVHLARKPAAMLAASPKGTVPVLVLGCESVIDESLQIMRWALANRDPDRWLERDDRDLVARNDTSFKQDLDRYKYWERYGADRTLHRANGLEFLTGLDTRLAAAGQLCGSDPGLTDAAILPFVRQFAAVDREWFSAQPLRRLRTWLDGHLASPLFQSVMGRSAPWSPDDGPQPK
jgi:glutathione S-transferase